MKNSIVINIRLTILMIACFSLSNINAQEEDLRQLDNDFTKSNAIDTTTNLALIHKIKDNKIMLRWAPKNPVTWLKANANGYILERKKYRIDLDVPVAEKSFTKLTSEAIKPWPLKDWAVFKDDENQYPLIAAQMIYGEQQVEPNLGNVILADDELSNRFGFHLLSCDYSQKCAEASGLFFTDNEADPNYMYEYRVYLARGTSKDTISTFVFPSLPKVTPDLEIIEALESENLIGLKWEKNSSFFNAFNIERSEDNINFEQLNEVPFINLESDLNRDTDYILYQDSIPENYKKYYYRIRAIDAFAEYTEYSKTISAMGKDRTAPSPPRNLVVEQDDENSAKLSWDWNAEMDEKDLAGFDIYHGTNPNEHFTKLNDDLISTKMQSFVHDRPISIAENYYYVSAIDTAGNVAKSLRTHLLLIDSIPPAQPMGVQAEIDTNGLVRLSWTLGPEIDIVSYDVYFSNHKNNVFTNRSKQALRDTVFLDTLNLQTLTEDIFYYVVAKDASFNESEPSEIVLVKKPDIVPPSPSVFLSYANNPNAITMSIAPSTSKDLMYQIIQRKTDESTWKEIAKLEPSVTSYMDENLMTGTYYSYRLIAVDDSENQTISSKKLRLKASGENYLPSPDNFSVTKNKDSINLIWEYDQTDQIHFILYKKVGTHPLMVYKRISTLEFTDSDYDKNKKYSYAIKAVNKNGYESKISDIVILEF